MLAALAVAALGLSLLFLYNSTSAQTQTASHFTYPENGKDPVTTLTASDPERVATTVWDLLTDAADPQDINGDGKDNVGPADVVDYMDFEISDGGVLSFMDAPNFEIPTDRVGAAQAASDTASPSTAAEADDNIYRVTVQATDGRTGMPYGWYKVVVTVTDMEEPGKITVMVVPVGITTGGQDLLQFQPGAVLTATLNDPDSGADTDAGNVTGVAWEWSGGGTTTDAAAYTVVDADVGKLLMVTASYIDNFPKDAGDSRKMTWTAPNVVQATRTTTPNNVAPEFASAAPTRTVGEDAEKGATIGTPVEATDDNGDILTYTLGMENDEAPFSIDKTNGQLMVKSKLDYENPTDDTQTQVDGTPEDAEVESNNRYIVQVIATDSMGGSATATVTITVSPAQEAPSLTTEVNEIQKVARIQIPENQTALDADPDSPAVYTTDPTTGIDPATFTGVDPEGTVVTLTTAGPDGGMFKLTATTDADDGYTETLAFMAKPDFEKPGDANGDNIYEVTVVATDGNSLTAMKQVTVKVTNVEERGMVTVVPAQPVAGVEITATLSDSDIFSPATVTWKWQLGTDADNNGIDDDEWADIGKAASATYTPKDDDQDKYLRAVATYYDMTYAMGDTDCVTAGIAETGGTACDATADRFQNTAMSAGTAQVSANPANSTPKFDEGTSTERFVMENTPANADTDATTRVQGNIGDPVTATDGDGEILVYTLGGRDAALFDITSSDDTTASPAIMGGQISVKDGTMLDYEATKKTYTVTVTADDETSNSADARATITVTIYVINVDEGPTIMASTGGVRISGPTGVRYAEDRRDTVATYTADGATLTLSGADSGGFSFSNGALAFISAPDYETKSTYRVTVTATEGEMTATKSVIVTVTNVDEDGMVALSTTRPQIGTAITATVTDEDVVVSSSVRWKWLRGEARSGLFTAIQGATSADYTPVEADATMYLVAMASYTDGHGPGKSISAVTANMVPAVGAVDPLVTQYAGVDGILQKSEVITAINDYQDEVGGITKADVITLINIYQDS